MKKFSKIIFLMVIIISLCGCGKNEIEEEKNYDVEYPNVEENYSSMETLNASTTINNILHNYTFYLKNNRVVNASVRIDFNSDEEAKKYKNTIEKLNDYESVEVKNNSVTYFHNLESFLYSNYSREVLIGLLEKNDFIIQK